MIRVAVYFHGPMSEWNAVENTGQIPAEEIVAEFRTPFLWLARMQARSVLRGLNTGRCGYVIEREGKIVDLVEAKERE